MTRNDTVLKLDSVTKVYGRSRPVCTLPSTSFGVERGELIAVTGESGAGKSTLLNILGLLESPTTGTYSISGNVSNTLSARRKAKLRNSF